MAFAKERFSTPGDDAQGVERLEGQRRSGSVRLRAVAENDTNLASPPADLPEDEAKLARMVRALRELEDDILTKVATAERVLAQLASRGTHEDGGYRSWGEFETRMLADSPMLRAMRAAATTCGSAVHRSHTGIKRESGVSRKRETKALTSMARALERMRGLDADIHRCASDAQAKLRAIEVMHVYEECGYASFEEFLERALGPSPVLASAVALIACEPVAEQETAQQPPVDVGAPDPTDDLTDAFSNPFVEPPHSSAEGSPTATAPDRAPGARSKTIAPEAPGPTVIAKSGRRNRVAFVRSALLCVVASIAGAAAGIGSTPVTAKPPASEGVAPVVTAPPGVADHGQSTAIIQPAAKAPASPPAHPAADRHSSGR